MSYNPQSIEKKWQDIWQKNPVAKTKPTGSGKNSIVLICSLILLVQGYMWATGEAMCFLMFTLV